jgi:hypothetical protein
MHRTPHMIVHRDLTMHLDTPGTPGTGHTQRALVEASSDLRNLYTVASKVPRGRVRPTVAFPVVPGRVDASLTSLTTRTRRAARDPITSIGFERTRSELYPEPAPFVPFLSGRNARLVGRDPVVLVP